MLEVANLKSDIKVLRQEWGVLFTRDILNTDGSVWHRAGEVEPYPNMSTARTWVCNYRKEGWPVRLVMRELRYTEWKPKG
jgi:hypothetical protein